MFMSPDSFMLTALELSGSSKNTTSSTSGPLEATGVGLGAAVAVGGTAVGAAVGGTAVGAAVGGTAVGAADELLLLLGETGGGALVGSTVGAGAHAAITNSMAINANARITFFIFYSS